jgi:glycine dehydrogenase subunit 2
MYPLGSCTMKYNPKINQDISHMSGFHIHPLTPDHHAQGALRLYDDAQHLLSELCGMDQFSLHPYAGAHGELTGLMIMKKYHEEKGNKHKTHVIVPDNAHGTNPASVKMVGYDVIEVKSNSNGTVDLESLKDVLGDHIAGIMLTNPNTVGMFEKDILQVSQLIHDIDGLLYYDGANLNSILGVVRPGDMGFDIMHVNLHKTFSTPHGGGGPGSGPVGVKSHLTDFLPVPVVKKSGNKYIRDYNRQKSIGRITGFYGNFNVVVKAYAFIRSLGKEHISKVAYSSVLNANYVKESLKDLYKLPIDAICKHEFVFSGLKESNGVTTLDIAKRMLDFGLHPPTIYFPLVIKEAIMIEPVDSESKQEVDNLISVLRAIAKEAKEDPDLIRNAPHTTPVKRLDEVKAARQPILSYKDLTNA